MSMHRLVRVAAGGSLVALAACAGRGGRLPARGAPGAPARMPAGFPRNGLEVIGGMRWAHPSRELRSLAFTVTTRDVADSTSVGRARVYASLPGKLHVEELPSNRSGYVRNRQRLDVPVPIQIRVYRGGRLVEEQEISNFVVNPSLPSRAFDLGRWRQVNLGN